MCTAHQLSSTWAPHTGILLDAFLQCYQILSHIHKLVFATGALRLEGGRQLARADAWKLPTEGHRVFDGLRIFLNGDAATLGPLRKLLPYAGGLLEQYFQHLSMRQL